MTNFVPTPSTRLEDWLALLEQRHPTEIELGLERIAAVARRAGIGRPAPRVITVAGTNGKGSCVATLAALLRHAGLRVGVYTSPHLVHYNERIVLPTGNAEDEAICESFARLEQARGDISLTYFEFGTLAAFDLMARAACDIAVLEVGLGGRLDAVNLIDADVAVITAIDIDHQDWLGDSRDLIGVEKAGIARAARPVIIADPDPPAAMLTRLQEIGAQPLRLGQDFGVLNSANILQSADRLLPATHQSAVVQLQTAHGRTAESRTFDDWPELPLPSVLCALQAAWLIDHDGRVGAALEQRLPPVRLPGRWQRRWWRGHEVWLDVAHNAAAARLLATRVRRAQEQQAVRFHGVCGIMGDKDAAAILEPLADVLTSLELTDLPGMARAARAADLLRYAPQMQCPVSCSSSPEEALHAVVARAEPGDRILVFGSFYTVGPVLRFLDQSRDDPFSNGQHSNGERQ